MPYKVRYQLNVDFVPQGLGLGIAQVATAALPGYSGGEAQTMYVTDSVTIGSNTFLAADITAILAAMSADLSAQLNAAPTLARIQAFATGGG